MEMGCHEQRREMEFFRGGKELYEIKILREAREGVGGAQISETLPFPFDMALATSILHNVTRKQSTKYPWRNHNLEALHSTYNW